MRRRSEPREATPGASGGREALSLQFDLLNGPALVRELARIGERYE